MCPVLQIEHDLHTYMRNGTYNVMCNRYVYFCLFLISSSKLTCHTDCLTGIVRFFPDKRCYLNTSKIRYILTINFKPRVAYVLVTACRSYLSGENCDCLLLTVLRVTPPATNTCNMTTRVDVYRTIIFSVSFTRVENGYSN